MRSEANVALRTIPGKLHAVGMSNKLPHEVGGEGCTNSTYQYTHNHRWRVGGPQVIWG
jgi:hypothetical protein